MEINQLTTLPHPSIEQLSDLLVAVVGDGASVGFLPPLSRAEAQQYWTEALQPGVLLWTATEDSRILGTVQLHLAQKANGRHRAEVGKLLVHPTAQRRGIGRRLMETLEAEARARSITLLLLDTRAGDSSNRLYLALGFQEAGRIPDYAQSADGQRETSVFYYKLLS